MALRDQPYIPLYVQDYLTDEKLNLCSASSQGVYIKIMCILHKSEEYGCILLEQKFKQKESEIENFAFKLSKLLPFDYSEILSAISELTEEKVIKIEDGKLVQKRMVKDNALSIKRAESGSKGGKKTQFAKAKIKAKDKATSENEIEDENETENKALIENIVYPFDSEKFTSIWNHWKEYKSREFGFKYKSKQSEQAALSKLSKLSNNEGEAVMIIVQSMENGWKGFFELKNKSKNSVHIEDIYELAKEKYGD